MKLSLATLTALLMALARAAPVPGDSSEISRKALVEANVLNDAVENVGNDAANGLLKEVDGLVKQLTDALGGLLPLHKRGDTEITNNALIEAKVASNAVTDILNNAAKRDEDLDVGTLKRDETYLRGDAEVTDNELVDAKVANKAAKNILNDAAKRGDNTEIKDNALIKLSILNDALKSLLNNFL